ncbi:MAG: YIP1 family protein [candidate division KSB1 bacterium]|nr:YIP1 family protein [candidate division KSB1 bacterium]
MSNVQSQEKDMNVFQRIINVFLAPTATFTAVREKPKWIIPFILILLIGLFTTFMLQPVIADMQKEAMIKQYEKMGMSQQEMDQALEKARQWSGLFVYPSALIGVAMMLAAGGLVWLFVGNTVLASSMTFHQAMGLNVYRYLIISLGGLIKLPIMLSKNSMDVHFSLATFMPSDASSGFLYKFLANIEVFNIWSIAVLCIGLAVITRADVKKVWPWVAALFLIYYLAAAGLGTAFGQ